MRAERGGRGSARTSSLLAGSVLLLLLMLFASPVAAQIGGDIPDSAGTTWDLPDSHGFYINGTEGASSLERLHPIATGQPMGFVQFNSGSSTILEISSAPATETVTVSGDASVWLYASLLSKNTLCRGMGGVFGAGETSFSVWLDVGNTVVIDGEDTEQVALDTDWTDPHEFFVNTSYLNLTISPGDVITLTVDVTHTCPQDGRLWWGVYHAPSGVELTGDLLQPELSAKTDTNGIPRIEFIPISPWGAEDYDWQILDLVEIDDWGSGRHLSSMPSEDVHIEHFEIPHGTRIVEANRTALTWLGNITLPPGKYMIDTCITIDAGDVNEKCHIIGVHRFEVLPGPTPWLGPGWFWVMSLATMVAFMSWRMRERFLPWPTLVLLLALALLVMIPASTLPELEAQSTRDEAAAPSFSLLSHPSQGGGAHSLSDLYGGKHTLVLGVFDAGSPGAEQQKRDFDNASGRVGDDVAFAQIVTGEGIRAVDVDSYAALLNGSWPLLMDEAGGDVARQFPMGIADGVVVIDAGGFISSWSPGTMSQDSIVAATEETSRGSGQSMFLLFTLLLPSLLLLPLVSMSFPLRRTDPPDTPLIPGAGLIGTMGAGALGFAVWALPVALLSPFLGGQWAFVELGLVIWLGWQSVSLAIRGEIPELKLVSGLVHSRLPQGYRDWRHRIEFDRDVLLGGWVAWISWFAHPLLIPQGVGAVAAASMVGILLAVLKFVGFLVMAGLMVLILRGIGAMLGPLGRMLGNLGHEEVPRLWGCLAFCLALWWLAWMLTGPVWNATFA
jgi:hypothetical protein